MQLYLGDEGKCTLRATNELTEVKRLLSCGKWICIQKHVDRIAGITTHDSGLWKVRPDFLLIRIIAQHGSDMLVDFTLQAVQTTFFIKFFEGQSFELDFRAIAKQRFYFYSMLAGTAID